MKPILYADDSSFFYSYNKNVDPTNIINPELVKIVKWLNVNKLSLNIKKSNFIIFCPSYKQKGPELIPKIELQGQHSAGRAKKISGIYYREWYDMASSY